MTGGEALLGVSVAEWLSTYGYFIIVPLVLIEGNSTALILGVLSSLGVFNPVIAGLVYIGSDLVSNMGLYMLGKHGHTLAHKSDRLARLIAKVDQGNGKTSEFVELLRSHFIRIFLAVKLVPVPQLPTILILISGFIRISYNKFLAAFFLASPFKAFIYIGAGYFLASSIQDVSLLYNVTGIIVLAALVLVFFYFRYAHRYLMEHTLLGYLAKKERE